MSGGMGIAGVVLAATAFLGLTATAGESGAPDAASASWSANVSLSSRYVSRGLDLSNGPPVPAVAAEYRFASGWYVNGDAQPIDYFGNHLEADANAGYRGRLGALQYDLGAYDYYFPGTVGEKVRTREAGLRLSWTGHAVVPVVELYHSPNYFFGSGPSLYAVTGIDWSLPRAWQLTLRYAYSHVENLVAFGYPNYRTGLVALVHSVGRWDYALQLTDTCGVYLR